MRDVKPKPQRRLAPRRSNSPTAPSLSSHAKDLMELAVDAAQSRHLPDFLGRFAERSAHMLNAVCAGVAVFRGRETEVYVGPSSKRKETQSADDWVVTSAREKRKDAEIRAIPPETSTTFSGIDNP